MVFLDVGTNIGDSHGRMNQGVAGTKKPALGGLFCAKEASHRSGWRLLATAATARVDLKPDA